MLAVLRAKKMAATPTPIEVEAAPGSCRQGGDAGGDAGGGERSEGPMMLRCKAELLLKDSIVISNSGQPVPFPLDPATSNSLQLPVFPAPGGELQVIVHAGATVRLCLWTKADEQRLVAYEEEAPSTSNQSQASSCSADSVDGNDDGSHVSSAADPRLVDYVLQEREAVSMEGVSAGVGSATLTVAQDVEYKVVVIADAQAGETPQRFERYSCSGGGGGGGK
jgi:hypothetical protein